MADHRPFWKGTWRMRLYRADGREIACQEEQPESLLPFNNWRRRISFIDDLPGVGVSRYYLKAFEIKGLGPAQDQGHMPKGHGTPIAASRLDPRSGLIAALAAFGRSPAGPMFEPLVVEDTGDAWGAGLGAIARSSAGSCLPAGLSSLNKDRSGRSRGRSGLSKRAGS